jgi:outer membrane lipoprotein carrier protein
MKRLMHFVAAAFVAVAFTAGAASAAPVDDVVNKIQKVYDKVKSYKAKFNQEATSQSLKKTFNASGMVYYNKSGEMRWDYNPPDDQMFLVTSSAVILYKKQAKQIELASPDEVFADSSTTNFLAGLGKIKTSFKYASYQAPDFDASKFEAVELTPKEANSSITNITLIVDKKTFIVQEVRLHDFFANVTKIKFENVETDVVLPPNTFKFKVPEGVTVNRTPKAADIKLETENTGAVK